VARAPGVVRLHRLRGRARAPRPAQGHDHGGFRGLRPPRGAVIITWSESAGLGLGVTDGAMRTGGTAGACRDSRGLLGSGYRSDQSAGPRAGPTAGLTASRRRALKLAGRRGWRAQPVPSVAGVAIVSAARLSPTALLVPSVAAVVAVTMGRLGLLPVCPEPRFRVAGIANPVIVWIFQS
jgi:hypothetical protein